MKVCVVFFVVIFITSCTNVNESPTNLVFQINKSVSISEILDQGYIKNKDGFRILTKMYGDTLFIYSYDKYRKIEFKESTFCLRNKESLDYFLLQKNCKIIDTVLVNENIKIRVCKKDTNIEYEVEYDKNNKRVWVKYCFPSYLNSSTGETSNDQ